MDAAALVSSGPACPTGGQCMALGGLTMLTWALRATTEEEA